jgi:hypothetical protein
MKKIVVVVADGCVETIFTNVSEEVEVEIVDFDSCFDSRDEQEAMGDYVDQLRATMKEL